MAVSGGDGQVLAAMEPVFLTSRIGAWFTGVAALIVAGIVCNGVYMVFGTMQGMDGGDVLIIVLVGICAFIALHTAEGMTASVRVEHLTDGDGDGDNEGYLG